MQREDDPDTAAEGRLSTDDLAQPRDRAGENTAGTPSEVPTFPGEATTAASQPDEHVSTAADSGTQVAATGADSDAQGETGASDAEEDAPQLLTTEDEEGFRARWQEVQSKFVDNPRDAVHSADTLVADVMQKLAATFADHKQELEEQWNRGEQANTEDLRLALRHYRSFFNRLLVT
jgi:hypothetical protein